MDPSRALESFAPLRPALASKLTDVRLQLHWAAQVVGAFGRWALQARADDSHTAMSWLADVDMLVGHGDAAGRRVGLRLADLSLAILDEGRQIVGELPLVGQTLPQSMTWLEDHLRSGSGLAPERSMELPSYDMPAYPVSKGAPFAGGDQELFTELARWYSNAAGFLDAVARSGGRKRDVLCWPHHFDIATLLVLDEDEPDAEKARSIGVGMLGGDHAMNEPYYYVNPWPRPRTTELPPLDGGGQWHTEGWVGAVLRASSLSEQPQAQAPQILAFLQSAMKAAHHVLAKA